MLTRQIVFFVYNLLKGKIFSQILRIQFISFSKLSFKKNRLTI